MLIIIDAKRWCGSVRQSRIFIWFLKTGLSEFINSQSTALWLSSGSCAATPPHCIPFVFRAVETQNQHCFAPNLLFLATATLYPSTKSITSIQNLFSTAHWLPIGLQIPFLLVSICPSKLWICSLLIHFPLLVMTFRSRSPVDCFIDFELFPGFTCWATQLYP